MIPYAVEADICGRDHASIAALLFELWHFPPTLESAVQYHHTPRQARSKLEPSIVHVADIIAHVMAIGKSGNPYVPPLVPEAWITLGMPASALAPLMTQADYQLGSLLDIFLS